MYLFYLIVRSSLNFLALQKRSRKVFAISANSHSILLNKLLKQTFILIKKNFFSRIYAIRYGLRNRWWKKNHKIRDPKPADFGFRHPSTFPGLHGLRVSYNQLPLQLTTQPSLVARHTNDILKHLFQFQAPKTAPLKWLWTSSKIWWFYYNKLWQSRKVIE